MLSNGHICSNFLNLSSVNISGGIPYPPLLIKDLFFCYVFACSASIFRQHHTLLILCNAWYSLCKHERSLFQGKCRRNSKSATDLMLKLSGENTVVSCRVLSAWLGILDNFSEQLPMRQLFFIVSFSSLEKKGRLMGDGGSYGFLPKFKTISFSRHNPVQQRHRYVITNWFPRSELVNISRAGIVGSASQLQAQKRLKRESLNCHFLLQ